MDLLMFHASLPSAYWVEALYTTTYLLNLRPTKTLSFGTPHFTLFVVHPNLSHLRVLGCKCYPNMSATTPQKLAPRSIVHAFLEYPSEHKGYQSSYHAMSHLMSPFFHSLRSMPHIYPPLIFFQTWIMFIYWLALVLL
jgi:hypothetical protein